MRAARPAAPVLGDDEPLRPRASDLSGFGRHIARRLLGIARSDQPTGLAKLLVDHLGPEVRSQPVVSDRWPAYDRVNVQLGLEAWLGEDGRSHQLVGIVGTRHTEFDLGTLSQTMAQPWAPRAGSVTIDVLPAGPNGETVSCIQAGLYLVEDSEGRCAVLVLVSESHGPRPEGVSIQVVSPDGARSARSLEAIRAATLAHNVFRGQVVVFGGEMFHGSGALLSFERRPHLRRHELVLPDGVLEAVERQVIGIAEHRAALQALGQHLKRGILLHGPPGTGKTHTVRYLLGRLEGVTVVLLSGESLGMLEAACSVARVLQPSVVVVEDVDLIAEERTHYTGVQPMLFELLNEMDGLGEDVDVAFVLTTNRPDLLEPALAARPGRVDQAVEIPLPNAEARRRLMELYRGSMNLELADTSSIVERMEGVTASFVKELLRRSALEALEARGVPGGGDGQAVAADLVVADADVNQALDELLSDRNRLTRVMLGGEPAQSVSPGLENGDE